MIRRIHAVVRLAAAALAAACLAEACLAAAPPVSPPPGRTEAGFDTVEKIAASTAEALSEVQGIGAKTAERILAAAKGDTAEGASGDAQGETERKTE